MNFLTNDLRNDAAYESCYAAARRKVPVSQAVGVASRRSGQNVNHKQLYFEIIDTIVAMMNNRFEDVEIFSFLDLGKRHISILSTRNVIWAFFWRPPPLETSPLFSIIHLAGFVWQASER